MGLRPMLLSFGQRCRRIELSLLVSSGSASAYRPAESELDRAFAYSD